MGRSAAGLIGPQFRAQVFVAKNRVLPALLSSIPSKIGRKWTQLGHKIALSSPLFSVRERVRTAESTGFRIGVGGSNPLPVNYTFHTYSANICAHFCAYR